MTSPNPYHALILKHLPPSPSTLHLLDVEGRVGHEITQLRDDLSRHVVHWPQDSVSDGKADAVVLFDRLPEAFILNRALRALRPGGRLIVLLPQAAPSDAFVRLLEAHGYIRILVEPALEGQGVLIRGEKPHTTADTHERVDVAASRDADMLTLETYRGRYIYLLVIQTPNKPVWRLAPDEPISWQAAALQLGESLTLLVFTSLPKAVSFMQVAVMQGILSDVNKMGKFTRQVASTWPHHLWLNPTPEAIKHPITFVHIDHTTAEAPDE